MSRSEEYIVEGRLLPVIGERLLPVINAAITDFGRLEVLTTLIALVLEAEGPDTTQRILDTLLEGAQIPTRINFA